MLVRRVPPVPSPILVEVFEKLKGRGYSVDSGIAEEMLMRPDVIKPEYDLYLLKSHTELTLSLAGILHDQGIVAAEGAQEIAEFLLGEIGCDLLGGCAAVLRIAAHVIRGLAAGESADHEQREQRGEPDREREAAVFHGGGR